MTIRQLKQRNFIRTPFFAATHLVAAGDEQRPYLPGKTKAVRRELPPRPGTTILSESIPLFYIAQNHDGFWVARAAEGRSGGLFLFRRSAVRFARKQSAPSGCALMFLNDPLELDVENCGSRFIEPLATAAGIAEVHVSTFAAFVGMAVTQWRKLVARMSRALAEVRRNRLAVERELFHGQYWLSSKNDDDLPVP
jgi:hypothetical protein